MPHYLVKLDLLKILIAFVYLQTYNCVPQKSNTDFKRLGDYDGRVAERSPLGRYTARSKIQCSIHCLETKNCSTFFFAADTHQCQLHDSMVELDLTLPDNRWRYYATEGKYNVICK